MPEDTIALERQVVHVRMAGVTALLRLASTLQEMDSLDVPEALRSLVVSDDDEVARIAKCAWTAFERQYSGGGAVCR